MGFFSGSKPSFSFRDYWTPERLKGGIEQFGSIYRPEAMDPVYARAMREMSEGISGEYASRGFGALRTGPAAYRASRERERFGEARAADEQNRLMDFLKMLQSGAVGVTTPGKASGFSALAGPLLGAVGKGIGGPLGGAISRGVGNLFGGGEQSYTPGNLFGSPGAMFT